MTNRRAHLDHDWYGGGVPANVAMGEDVYIDTSYAFAACLSELRPGVALGDASGVYDRATLVVGPRGRVDIGDYACLNGTYVICNERVVIGAHCLLAWGVVITDTWPEPSTPLAVRRRALQAAAHHPDHWLPPVSGTRPVVLEGNVWVGFGAVVMPGVTIGRGSIVGCKTVVRQDVSPYAVVVGDPARTVRHLQPDDTNDARDAALSRCVKER